ncbi:MAG: Holliday junction resolvase RuvX [Xanthomonadales bacterium]|nr:Holliday junction resolvase RuvX [Xanthomonadales bacterium]
MPDTVLSFDFGLRRIGVAIGQSLTGTATALATIDNPADELNWTAITGLVEAWHPDAMVVGIPLTEAGEEQAITRAARSFAGKLADRYRLPVHHADERYTSVAAEARFRDQRRAGQLRRRNRDKLDAVAAKLILEQWFADRAT